MERPGYYAVIPASVRYDKDLSMGSRMLYGEITALCNAKGYCWAANSYFADLYGKTDRTIRSWISELAEKKYITVKMIYKEGSKEVEKRIISLDSCHEISAPMEENFRTPTEENFQPPQEKNFLDNNTRKSNITSINNKKICAEQDSARCEISAPKKPTKKEIDDNFKKLWSLYPEKKGIGSVSDATKRKIYDIGFDEMKRAIERYLEYLQHPENDWIRIKNGSTFFNSGHVDYLDRNWKEDHNGFIGENTGYSNIRDRVSTESQIKVSSANEIIQRMYETGVLNEAEENNGPFK